MSLPSGTHDKRTFRHFAKLAADGSIAATVEVAAGFPDPVDGEGHVYVDVTELHPYDFRGVKVKAKDLSDRNGRALIADLKAKNQGKGNDARA